MTHHGTPLKRMGLDLRDTQIAGKRMDFGALLRRCARWDFSVSSNRAVHARVGARVSGAVRDARDRLPAQRPARHRLAGGRRRRARRARASRTAGSPCSTRRRTASTARATSRRWTSPRSPTASAPDHVLLARLHYFYGADPVLRRLHDEGRIRDVSRHPSIESCAWPRTCW